MHSEIYCKTLESLDHVQAIRAIQQALLQMEALDSNVDCEHFDNGPAMEALRDCLKSAGHLGFAELVA